MQKKKKRHTEAHRKERRFLTRWSNEILGRKIKETNGKKKKKAHKRREKRG